MSALFCRCCLLRPPDKDLKTAYPRLGKNEIYADMLKECFEIHLSLDKNDSGICEVCITRLRDACDFKSQVQLCQKSLQHQAIVKAEGGSEADTVKVKQEKDDAIILVKEEISDYGNDYDDEDDRKLAEILGLREITVKRKDRKRKRMNDKDAKKPLKLNLRSLKIDPTASVNSIKFVKISENQKHKSNIENILKYSNCTPFSNKSLTGIMCAYCKENFQNITALKTHTDSQHSKDTLCEKGRDKNNLSIKMDITDLKCNLCEKKLEKISNLKTHLSMEHDIKFYPDIIDYILEFKITDGEILNCALCNSTFETFKMLLQHMNGHYRNYICDICDMGFINRHRLKNHQRTHETGTFKCTFCDKIFTTKVRKVCHEKYTHNTSARYTTNCPHCNLTFNSYYQRNRHMFQEHNIAAATYKCNICDKSFILKSKLTSHIKKIHLMERNHICPECGQGFFIKQSLDEHMIRHNGERVFKCTFCHKAYARKKTLREHLRIHNNDRRFKCGVCGLAFVQKCSLKSHMLSNHGVTLAEFESAKELATSVVT